ncbi:MAG: ABC transporter ATP-binding protein [Flavobacteriales bacterium]|nr:ABC transporter ATP-binding protein [Flavobacteriales bacterium]
MLSVNNVSKVYEQAAGGTVQVLENISLSGSLGEFVVIRGANGSGKSTLLRLISGLESPSTGSVMVHGRKPGQAELGFLFQDYVGSMLPWMSLRENATLPLRLKKRSRVERHAALGEVLQSTGITNIPFDRYPHQSSGGQQQKTGFLRAILSSKDFLILDEPFSSLDRAGEDAIRNWLQRLRRAQKALVILVVHDLDDAILLADRIYCLDGSPTTVRDVVPVPLPWPRDPSVRLSAEFLAIRQRILSASIQETI